MVCAGRAGQSSLRQPLASVQWLRGHCCGRPQTGGRGFATALPHTCSVEGTEVLWDFRLSARKPQQGECCALCPVAASSERASPPPPPPPTLPGWPTGPQSLRLQLQTVLPAPLLLASAAVMSQHTHTHTHTHTTPPAVCSVMTVHNYHSCVHAHMCVYLITPPCIIIRAAYCLCASVSVCLFTASVMFIVASHHIKNNCKLIETVHTLREQIQHIRLRVNRQSTRQRSDGQCHSNITLWREAELLGALLKIVPTKVCTPQR